MWTYPSHMSPLKAEFSPTGSGKESQSQSMRGVLVSEVLHCKDGMGFEDKDPRVACKSWERY